MGYDPRSVANILLDLAEAEGVALTNLSLNKILCFLHAWHLAEFGTPLIGAKIEAWEYGPVIREVYSEFKKFGASPITGRAERFDVDKLQKVVCEDNISSENLLFIKRQFSNYGCLSAGKLVSMSHEKGGPWDLVYNESGKLNPGMEISDSIIREYFVHQTKH